MDGVARGMQVTMTYLIVTGPSGSGKSTLAEELAVVLQWPYLAKDQFQERLADSLGLGTPQWSDRLGEAALDLLFLVARSCPNAVVDPTAEVDVARVTELVGPTLQIFCTAPPEVLVRRVLDRRRRGERHPVHFDAAEETEVAADLRRRAPEARPLPLDGALLCIDTSGAIDTGAIVSWVWSRVTESYAGAGRAQALS